MKPEGRAGTADREGGESASEAAVAGRARILRVLLEAGIVVVLATLVLLTYFEGSRVPYWPYATLLAGHGAAWFLLRRGRLRAAVFVHATIYTGTILLVLAVFGGLRSPATFALSPIVLLVGLAWSSRAALVAAAVGSAGMLAVLLLRAARGVEERGEITYWVVATGILALTSVVLALALRSIGRAQERALAAERERLELLEQIHRNRRLETVSRLAAGVAHDFNNLLNVIIGHAERLEGNADPAAAHAAGQIAEAAWRASDLTQQLLTVGRRQGFEARELDLNRVVRDLESLLRRSIELPDRLRFELAEGPLQVRSDSTRLEQVLLNLVRNAADATEAGGEIVVRTGRATSAEVARLPDWRGPSRPAVRLEVADTGTGMTPEVKAQLFEPFFTTKETGRGTGLGLASVYAIVQQGGGAIAVESEVGRGSRFAVYFPAEAA